MQAEAHYNKIKAPFILHHQLYLHIFIKKRYSTIAQAATISFPKGVNASPASLKCWIPKGMPIMVMHSNNPNPKCERQIQMPPKNIQRIFINILRQPPESGQLLTSFPNGHNASKDILRVCRPKGIPIIVIIIKRLDIKYSTAVNMPPSRSHKRFINKFILSIF